MFSLLLRLSVLLRSLGSAGPWLGGFFMSALAPGGPAFAVLAEVQAEDSVVVGLVLRGNSLVGPEV